MDSDLHQKEEKSSTPSTPRKTGTRPSCKETVARFSGKNTKELSIDQKFHNLSRGHLSYWYGVTKSRYSLEAQGARICRNIRMEYGEAYTVVEKLPSDKRGMKYGD
jgi:hypothetical protein